MTERRTGKYPITGVKSPDRQIYTCANYTHCGNYPHQRHLPATRAKEIIPELIRAWIAHTSDALFRYEKPSLKQQLRVSKVLAPPQRHVSFKNEKIEDKID